MGDMVVWYALCECSENILLDDRFSSKIYKMSWLLKRWEKGKFERKHTLEVF